MKNIYECIECGESFKLYSEQCPKCKTNYSIESKISNIYIDEENEIFDSGLGFFDFD